MSKGYIVIAQNSEDTNYLRMAYALALSLKITQSKVSNLAVCVEDKSTVPEKYKKEVIELFEGKSLPLQLNGASGITIKRNSPSGKAELVSLNV